MPEFAYRGWNAERNAASGEIAAETVAHAVMQLEAQGIEIASIGLVERKATVTSAVVREGGESNFDPELLRAPIEQVLAQGKLLLPALHAFAAELPQGRRKQQIEQVCQVIEDCNTSEALQALVENPEYWLPLIGAMSSKQDPVRAVRSFFAESQSAEELTNQWRQAIVYPLVCLGVCLAVLTALAFVVVPAFRGIFADFSIDLPLLTVVALDFAHLLTIPLVHVGLGIFLALSLLFLTADRWMPRRWHERFKRRLPHWVTSATISRFSSFTADLLDAGVQTPAALRIAGIASQVPRMRQSAWQLASALENKTTPVVTSAITATLIYAIQPTLSTATRSRLLKEISVIYGEKSRSRISWSRGVVEPLLICSVGLIVGAFVLAMFLPLVNLVVALT